MITAKKMLIAPILNKVSVSKAKKVLRAGFKIHIEPVYTDPDCHLGLFSLLKHRWIKYILNTTFNFVRDHGSFAWRSFSSVSSAQIACHTARFERKLTWGYDYPTSITTAGPIPGKFTTRWAGRNSLSIAGHLNWRGDLFILLKYHNMYKLNSTSCPYSKVTSEINIFKNWRALMCKYFSRVEWIRISESTTSALKWVSLCIVTARRDLYYLKT